MAQCEGAVPQLPEVLVLPSKQFLGLGHLPLEPGDALRRLAEQPQDLYIYIYIYIAHRTVQRYSSLNQTRPQYGQEWEGDRTWE